MGELHWYIHQEHTTSEEAAKTSETLAYLEACHFLFERGLESHERIRSLDSDAIKNINKGYHYFSGWLTDLIERGMCINYNISAHFYFNRSIPLTHRRSFYLGKVVLTLIAHTYLLCWCITFVYVAWDLLQIDVYGFNAFAKWFLETY